jgi:DNA-binding transcriptional LysR family regulator
MDTMLLTAFLEVAQRLHFGQAADHLGVTQPALSHQIRRLEATVGAMLLERTSRQVRLTPAGQAFMPEARRVLADLERAVFQCRAVAAGGVGHLKIGSIGSGLSGITPRIVRELRSRLPGLAVQVTQMDSPVQLAALRAGELDLGVVRSAGPAAGISLTDLDTEPMIIAVPVGHRLSASTIIAASDLRDEPFVLLPRTVSPIFHDQVVEYCATAGFTPHVALEGADVETQLGLVSAGLGVSPQPASFANLRRHGVDFRPLRDAPTTIVQLAWLADAPFAHLDTVLQAARAAVD